MSKFVVRILYYAILKEKRGLSEESINTQAVTALDLYQELKDRHSFDLSSKSLKVAINDEFTSWDTRLQAEDTVIFIPPVAGG